MSTAVSSSTLNLAASGMAANPDTSRNAANGMLRPSFSDLLRGQTQNSIDTHTPAPLTDTRTTPAPTRTPPPPSPEAPHEASRPTPTPQASPPPQEPAREPVRAKDQNNSPEIRQTAETPPPKQANTGTGKPATKGNEEKKTSGNIAPTEHLDQPQPMDATISPDLPATIATLLNGIAGNTLVNASDAESPAAQDAATHDAGHSWHPDAPGSLSARAATLTDTAIQADDEDMGSNTDGNNSQGANQNPSALLTGRTFKSSTVPNLPGQAAAAFGANVDSPALVTNTVVPNIVNAIPAALREDGGVQAAPVETSTNIGDISMLNPPRLSTQVGAGASLPQFTIPLGAGQRAWVEEVGNRVIWMLGRAESRAELILTPPPLGKVEVSIHLNGDQSTAQFLASSQSAREALEQAMPRLRELLAQAGINLGEASVNTSTEDRAQNGENTRHPVMSTPDSHDDGDNGDANVIAVPNWSKLGNGLINTFA
ncbi:MAG: flagellar hook-length control protein FliK [Betaproteobacteria bacterium]|nr:flagellar hook-length control protein FliK [Betaproteobacteria bacterium]